MMGRRKTFPKWMKWAIGIVSAIVIILAVLWTIPIDDVVMATGVVEPEGKIYIDAPFKRVVKKIHAYEGTQVKKGQTIAQLEDADLISDVVTAEDEVRYADANLEMAKARLEHLKAQPLPEQVRMAEARVRSAKINFDAELQKLRRTDNLWARELITQSEEEIARTRFELAKSGHEISVEILKAVQLGASISKIREADAEVEASRASLVKAQHTLELARSILERTTLKAPEDGIVVRVDVHPGMVADQGDIVMIIARGEGSILRAWIKEINVWKVRRGQPVQILSNVFMDREEFLSTGEVIQTYPYGVDDRGERTFEIKVKINNAVVPPPLGSTADARIIVGRRGILKILLGYEDDIWKYVDQDTGISPRGNGDSGE